MKGMIVYSFALRDDEPGPCNINTAFEANRIYNQEAGEICVVSQWEVARALDRFCPVPIARVVREHRVKGAYLDSGEVTEQAAEVFRAVGVKEIIIVANPFMHLQYCRYLVCRKGFRVLKRRIRWIGFDRQSIQWETRGPIRALAYTAIGFLTGRRGPHFCPRPKRGRT